MLNLSLFAERLEELMVDKNIHPTELANAVGIDRTTVTRYLSGRKIPSVDVLIRLADYFGVSMDFLLALEDENYGHAFKECPPFSERLPFLLAHFNISKYGLQKQTRIPESAIFNWLRGDYTPTVDNLIKIAKCFGCSVDFVIGRGD